MTPYFKALLAFMFVFSIAGIMFDGLRSSQGAVVTMLLSGGAALALWFLSTRNKDKNN